MSRSGNVTMNTANANKIIALGKQILDSDDPLGFPQAAHVVLLGIASGEYKLTKVRKKAPPKEEE